MNEQGNAKIKLTLSADAKRIIAFVLAAVLLVGLLPRLLPEVNAESEPIGVNTDGLGQYIPCKISNNGNVCIMNGGVTGIPTRNDCGVGNMADLEKEVTLASNATNAMPADVSKYNALSLMPETRGIRDSWVTDGIHVWGEGNAHGKTMVNSGNASDDSRPYGPKVTVGMQGDDDQSGTCWLEFHINKYPNLYRLAEEGKLEFYFTCLVCGSKQDISAWPDDHVLANGRLYVNDTVIQETTTSTSTHTSGLIQNWRQIGKDDVIKLYVRVWEKRGSTNHDVGLCNAALFFRSTGSPYISSVEMDAYADYHKKGSEKFKDEVLFNAKSSFDLQISFSRTVRSIFGTSARSMNDISVGDDVQKLGSLGGEGDRKLLDELANHVLFNNPTDTGYENSGQPVKLRLYGTDRKSCYASGLYSSNQQIDCLTSMFNTLKFQWKAADSPGAYSGNQAIPGGADWRVDSNNPAKYKSSAPLNNTYGFLNKLALASIHDMAGNPLTVNSGSEVFTLTPPKTNGVTGAATDRNATIGSAIITCKLTVGRNSKQTFTNLLNPFDTYDFIIDAEPPTFSETSNGVQPEILTGLALNRNRDFYLTLNFSEGVQTRLYYEDGSQTGLTPTQTYLQFKPAPGQTETFRAEYVDGNGTKSWKFHTTIPEGSQFDISAINTDRLYNEKDKTNVIITDYVGNPLQDYSSSAAVFPMDWAGLQIDNTPPSPIQITKSGKQYRITASDPTVNGSQSGIFAPVNTTSDSGTTDKSLVYYTWVEASKLDKAIEDLTAQNYAIVKRASLVGNDGTIPYNIFPLNNGDVVSPPDDEGEWVLLAFAADKTWDASRQLTQQKEYKRLTATEDGATNYYKLFLEQCGMSSSSSDKQVEYTLTTQKPDDWESSYSNYYKRKTGNSSYEKLSKGESYPDWNTNTNRYYKKGYIKLTEDPTKDDANLTWEDVYEQYYVLKNGEYVQAPHQNKWPDFEPNKYYAKYAPVSGASAPSDWTTAQFYSKVSSGAPIWQEGTYYTKSNDNYVLQTSQPSDWTSSYEKYYTKSNEQYVSVESLIYTRVSTDGVPDFKGDIYKLTFTEVKAPEQPENTPENTEETQPTRTLEDMVNDGNYYIKDTANPGAYIRVTKPTTNSSLQPAFNQNTTYYEVTATKQTSEPSDWKTKYQSYYELTATTFIEVDADAGVPAWKSDTYYKLENGAYSLLKSKPSDWDTTTTTDGETTYACENYFAWVPDTYRPVQKVTPVEYAANTYYRKNADFTALTAEPSGWSAEYREYFQKSGNDYVHIPEKTIKFSDGGPFYTSGYLRLNEQPADWRKSSISGSYYFYVGNGTPQPEMIGGEFENLSVLPKSETGIFKYNDYVTFRLYGAPEWEAGTYYKAELSIAVLESAFQKKRWESFQDDMIKAESNLRRMEIIGNYYELASILQKANRLALQNSAKYEEWSSSAFTEDDSNWVYAPVSSTDSSYVLIDYIPPTISLVEGSLSGDGTADASVQVDISDNDEITVLKYAFVKEGTPLDENTLISALDEGETFKKGIYTFSTQEYASNDNVSLDMHKGNFDLYVWAEDKSGNREYENLVTVTLDSGVSVAYELLLPDGSGETVIKSSASPEEVNMTTNAYKEVPLAVRFAGKIDGKDIFDSSYQFKVEALIDDSAAAPSDSAVWTTVSADSGSSQLGDYTARHFTLPVVRNAAESQTTKYLHLRYSYFHGNERTTRDAFSPKAFLLNTKKPGIAFNLMHSGTDYATVQMTVNMPEGTTGAAKYQWLAGRKIELPDGSEGNWKDAELSGTLTIDTTDAAAKSGKGIVTLCVRATNNLGNEQTSFFTCVLNDSSVIEEVAPPAPEMLLLGLQKSGSTNYAIVKLSLKDSSGREVLPEEGAEYSWALVSGGEAPVWSRWIPYESMVRVEIGSDLSKTLKFKFRSSSGEMTDERDYLSVGAGTASPFTSGTDSPWAIVSRSTFQTVKADKGLALRFISSDGASVFKDGEEIQTDTIRSNGVYSYAVRKADADEQTLYVAVNNIKEVSGINWSLSFSETERTASPVLATLTLEEGAHVESVRFRPEGSLSVTKEAPDPNYLFTENGTATFTIVDQFGDSETATATVNWLDSTPPVLFVEPDYTSFSRVKDSNGNVISTGAALRLRSAGERVLLTSYDAQLADSAQDGVYSTDFTFAIWENGSYSFTAQDALGNTSSVSMEVNNLISSIPEPQVTVRVSDNKDKALVIVQGTVENAAKALGRNYRLYDGKSSESPSVTLDGNGVYTIVRTYRENRSVTGYVSDFLGNVVSYTAAVSGIDRFPPTITVTGSPIVEQDSDPAKINWREYVTLRDDATAEEDITLTVERDNGKPIETKTSGSYRILLTATDKSGNVSETESLYLYVIPGSGIVITDEDGILFYAASKDVALVKDDQITLTVDNYQLMEYFENGKTQVVENSDATYDIYIQKGLFREGQLKYIRTLTLNDIGGEGQSKSVVNINPEQLDGPGWYTIIVRNSERAREYTTFFIASTKKK